MTPSQLLTHPDFDAIYIQYLLDGGRKSKKGFANNVATVYDVVYREYDQKDNYQVSHSWLRVCHIIKDDGDVDMIERSFRDGSKHRRLSAFRFFQ